MQPFAIQPFVIQRVDHLVLRVRDLARSEAFCTIELKGPSA